jgi:hypothetical protein
VSGNTGNTSNVQRKLRAIQFGGAVAMALFEAFVLAEILWYYLHDGDETLHGAVREYVEGLRARATDRAAFETVVRDGIRNLPETD